MTFTISEQGHVVMESLLPAYLYSLFFTSVGYFLLLLDEIAVTAPSFT